MHRFAVPAILVSIVVLALCVGAYLLGIGLLPSHAESIEKGTQAPYFIVWGMVWIVEACGIALAVSLFRAGLQGLRAR
jgi:hypothetical protein